MNDTAPKTWTPIELASAVAVQLGDYPLCCDAAKMIRDLAGQRDALKAEHGWQDEVLAMIYEECERHPDHEGDKSMSATPPMMYPEAIRSRIVKARRDAVHDAAKRIDSLAAEVARLRERIEVLEALEKERLAKLNTKRDGLMLRRIGILRDAEYSHSYTEEQLRDMSNREWEACMLRLRLKTDRKLAALAPTEAAKRGGTEG